MREARGDIFNTECDAVGITTNGFVKVDGRAVMGKGCAKAAAEAIPIIPSLLGHKLQESGNHVHVLYEQNGVKLFSFPVKPKWREYHVEQDVVTYMRGKFNAGDKVPGWASSAIPALIEQSAHELVELANTQGWEDVVLPRPGCGAGELDWANIKKILEPILDDRFTCMTF
jgi:hypothetical protein